MPRDSERIEILIGWENPSRALTIFRAIDFSRNPSNDINNNTNTSDCFIRHLANFGLECVLLILSDKRKLPDLSSLRDRFVRCIISVFLCINISSFYY